jgi:hypothetical protein
MYSAITNIYNKKTKGPSLMEFFTATGKLKSFFFCDNKKSLGFTETWSEPVQRHLQRITGDH